MKKYKPIKYSISRVILDAAQIAEIREFYDGSRASCRALADRFSVPITRIEYIVNYKNRRKESREYQKEYKKKNPKDYPESRRNAMKRYYSNNREEISKRQHEYYIAHKKERKEYDRRKRHEKNKSCLLREEFNKYCKEHPEERFWQALRNWSGADKIIWVETDNGENIRNTIGEDTFYWEEKIK
jgi:DNA polymerase sigma